MGWPDAYGDVAEGLGEDATVDVPNTCVAVARLVDGSAFLRRSQNRTDVFFLRPGKAALESICQIARNLDASELQALAAMLITDPIALSVAVDIANRSFLETEDEDTQDFPLRAPPEKRMQLLSELAANIEYCAREGSLFSKANTEHILWSATRLVPEKCKAIFAAVQEADPTLDAFAEALLRYSFDSRSGQSYGIPKDRICVEKFESLELLTAHGQRRLADQTLQNPVRAAWRSLVEDRKIYGSSGAYYDE